MPPRNYTSTGAWRYFDIFCFFNTSFCAGVVRWNLEPVLILVRSVSDTLTALAHITVHNFQQLLLLHSYWGFYSSSYDDQDNVVMRTLGCSFFALP
jgi:hypothetical protein